MPSFSSRYGYEPDPPPITVRNDAPYDVRGLVADVAYSNGLAPHTLRSIVCGVLLTREDESNWSAFPNVDEEVRGHLDSCAWYFIYDIIEAVVKELANRWSRGDSASDPEAFTRDINRVFVRHGVGWQLRDGQVEIRGDEDFETLIPRVPDALSASGRGTAAGEMREAISDLSRRPNPDVTGAIQHSLAALECLCRDLVGDPRATFGQIVVRYPDLFPRPVDEALEKLWGYASEQGRHLREGRNPSYAEAELSVHVAAATGAYLLAKLQDAGGA